MSLNILIVDDSREVGLLVSAMLRKMGHTAVFLDSGAKALEYFSAQLPDMILLDVMMPDLDGFETAERIKKFETKNWIPLIFLTANTEDDAIARGIQIGADDYLAKPISFVCLKAKIDAFCRMLEMQRQIEEKNTELEYYYQAAEEEQRIASDLMMRMVRVDMLQDPQLSYLIQPAHKISGDLVAAARTPNGILHVLLADGTGHGLAASINVMPVAEPFYQMTAKGYGVSAIVTELNSKVKKWMPTERFVAATLVGFDAKHKLVEVWSGGNPHPMVLNKSGQLLHQFSQANWPLGIVSASSFVSQTELMRFNEDVDIVLFSDGAIEASNGKGIPLGREGLILALQNAPKIKRTEYLREFYSRITQHHPAQDDISIAIIDCSVNDLEAIPANSSGNSADLVTDNAGWSLHLAFSAQELKKIDVVPLLLNTLQHLMGTQPNSALFLVISELYNNAVDHGLLKLESSLKYNAEGFDNYFELRHARLMALQDANLTISCEIRLHHDVPMLHLRMKDSGDGFDYLHFLAADPSESIALSGRGIHLVKRLSEQLEYFGNGNEVLALFNLSPH